MTETIEASLAHRLFVGRDEVGQTIEVEVNSRALARRHGGTPAGVAAPAATC